MMNKPLNWIRRVVSDWRLYIIAGALGLTFVHIDAVLHIINHFLSDYDVPGIRVFTSFADVEFVLGVSVLLVLIGLVLKIVDVYNEGWG